MATTGAPAARMLGHRQYPDPTWDDKQRVAWECARAALDTKDLLYHGYALGVIPSMEPFHRAWLAWHELERELAPLFAGECGHLGILPLPLSTSGQRWLNERRDMFEVFYVLPVLEAAATIARARGGRSITAVDLDAAEAADDLPLPPQTRDPKGDGRA